MFGISLRDFITCGHLAAFGPRARSSATHVAHLGGLP
jgi:hypothetical protein